MTAIACIFSLLGATIFPQVANPPSATAVEPLQGVRLVPAADEAAPLSFGPYPGDGAGAFERAVALADDPPAAEMPGQPSPDAEPIPYRPTPEQPDGPAMPPPRNYGGDVRGRALAKIASFGAAQWQIDVFDCIGWHESGWQSKRSNKANYNGTYDHGPFQINDVHWSQLNAQGLDPYVPEDAATYVWQLSRQGTRFGAWSVHSLCGV